MPVQYEVMLAGGGFDIPVTVPGRDLRSGGLAFYCQEKMSLNTRLRMTVGVGDKERVIYIGKVVRIEISGEPGTEYVAGVEYDTISEADRARIEEFIKKVDLDAVIAAIPLDGVVDINFIAGFSPVVKKVKGLIIQPSAVFDEYTLKCLLFSILDKERYKKFLAEKELNFVYSYSEKIRFRVNLHMQRGKAEATFRCIPPAVSTPSQLGLPRAVERLLAENKKGLILIAGRTGSGKTTTLAAMVNYLNNNRSGIVVTIEDPVEYIHTNNKCIIKQREIGRDTLSFSAAAKNALRQNPDILVIGEILDVETMDVAITAAETGSLVLATIHAGNCVQALDRAIGFFAPDVQKNILSRLSMVVKGVITQMLIPKLDESGLVVAAEVLVANDAIRKLIRTADWKSIPSFIQTGKNLGMQLMRDSLEVFCQQGIIDPAYLLEESKT